MSRLWAWSALALYAVLVAVSGWRHEPWADEAQAWLLARDATLGELWTRLLSYEGSPGLWHTLLWALNRLGAPYALLSFTSGALGCAAAWLLSRHSPLPLGVRLTLPFTFFLCFQYAVVARSYALIPVLLFACAVSISHTERRFIPTSVLLCLLAATSVHGFVLSAAIWVTFLLPALWRWKELPAGQRRRFAIATAVYGSSLVLLAWSAWPAPDVGFPYGRESALAAFLPSADVAFTEAFAGDRLLSWVVIGLSAPLLYRGGGLPVFLLASLLLCGIAAFLHAQAWHHGLLFLVWIFAIWMSVARVGPGRTALAAMAIVIATQCYWTAKSVAYDWSHPYSGSLEAARYLRGEQFEKKQLYGFGYSSTAIQPYFSQNIFSNLNGGAAAAYWDWSSENRGNDPSVIFSSSPPDYAVVGYKDESEKERWARVLALAGCRFVKSFEGHLYWRTRRFEAEAFDLYRRDPDAAPLDLSSALTMADDSSARQLLTGFYGVEAGDWRWTARRFSVALAAPEHAREKGGRLELRFHLPEGHIQKLGPMTLVAEAGDVELAPATYSTPGDHAYTRRLPASKFGGPAVAVNFVLDRAVPPSAADARELGVVALSIELAAVEER